MVRSTRLLTAWITFLENSSKVVLRVSKKLPDFVSTLSGRIFFLIKRSKLYLMRVRSNLLQTILQRRMDLLNPMRKLEKAHMALLNGSAFVKTQLTWKLLMNFLSLFTDYGRKRESNFVSQRHSWSSGYYSSYEKVSW